jgi:cell division protein FtsB
MKNSRIILVLVVALGAALFSLATDGSLSRMKKLERSVLAQQEKNAELEAHVGSLKSEIKGLQTDERALEKAARNELGLAREKELIFVFEKNPNTSK